MKRLFGFILILAGATIIIFSMAVHWLRLSHPGSGFGHKQYFLASTGVLILIAGAIVTIPRFRKRPVSPIWRYLGILLLSTNFFYGLLLFIYPHDIELQLVKIRNLVGAEALPREPLLEELLLFFESRARDKWLENQARFNLNEPATPKDAQDLIDAIREANCNFANRTRLMAREHVISNLEEKLIGEVRNSRRWRIRFQNGLGLTVAGILSVPLEKRPHPVIIIPNGMTSTPENLFLIDHEDYHRGVACRFEGSYVVFALHIPSSPDFSYELMMHNRMNWAAEAMGIDYRYYETVDKVVSALDYLETKPAIDPSRIAIYGISLGGDTSIDAGVEDKRINVIAASGTNVFSPSYQQMFVQWRYMYPYYYRYNRLLLPDAGTKLLASYPRRLIIELGRQDSTGDFNAALRRAQQIKRIYSVLGQADNVKIITFNRDKSNIAPNGHEMEVNCVQGQIDRWFGIQH